MYIRKNEYVHYLIVSGSSRPGTQMDPPWGKMSRPIRGRRWTTANHIDMTARVPHCMRFFDHSLAMVLLVQVQTTSPPWTLLCQEKLKLQQDVLSTRSKEEKKKVLLMLMSHVHAKYYLQVQAAIK